ncbi:PepSY domain-containing protein [Ensifer sp. MJa1]|uniref:PepSY domain-containing protein n=1 Tax=Ensifer sp. MJa1 TaxID=2919888 RepID=UPI003008D606
MRRRDLIALFCGSLLLSLVPLPGGMAALASDDDSANSGSSHGGSDDSDNSGRGGGGHGGDDDDDDRGKNDDDDNDDDADDDDNSGQGSGRRSDQERARDGVAKGNILPLKDVLRLVDEDKYGRVIAIDLRRSGDGDVYRLRTRDRQGTIRNLRMNARTGKFINIFGF